MSGTRHTVSNQYWELEINTIEIYKGINQKISTVKLIHNSNNICRFKVEIPPLAPTIAILKK